MGRVLGLGVGFLGGIFAGWRWDRLGLQGDVVGFWGRRVVLGHRGSILGV